MINIWLKFVPRDPINNIPSLVQIMAWRRPGDKPLSEPMMVSSLTHICVTRPQWVKAPSHFLNQIKLQPLRIKLWSNWNQHMKIFIQENASETVVCETAAIWFKHQCVNTLRSRQNGRHFPDNIFKAFSWIKIFAFWIQFDWILSLRGQLTIIQHWFTDQAIRQQAIIWTNDGLGWWCIYVPLGLNELNILGCRQPQCEFKWVPIIESWNLP